MCYMYKYSFCIYVCVPYACNACGGQKRVLNPLEQELQGTVGGGY